MNQFRQHCTSFDIATFEQTFLFERNSSQDSFYLDQYRTITRSLLYRRLFHASVWRIVKVGKSNLLMDAISYLRKQPRARQSSVSMQFRKNCARFFSPLENARSCNLISMFTLYNVSPLSFPVLAGRFMRSKQVTAVSRTGFDTNFSILEIWVGNSRTFQTRNVILLAKKLENEDYLQLWWHILLPKVYLTC